MCLGSMVVGFFAVMYDDMCLSGEIKIGGLKGEFVSKRSLLFYLITSKLNHY